jgi:hypothetical protein
VAILDNKALFRYPLTPTGKASLLDLATEPSHRIAGYVCVILIESDPEVVRAYVPEPIDLDGQGRVFLRTFDGWFYTDRQSSEFVSEERVNYTETFFWIPCTYEGELYYYMPFSWVNRDWLAYLGRHGGMPHKLAKVQMTRFTPADPVYYGPHEGVRVSVAVECNGLVVKAHVDLESKGELPFRAGDGYCPKYLGHRYVYDIVTGKPALNDLVAHWGDRLQIPGDVWTGDASVTFFDCENEEVLAFQPRRVLGGWVYPQLFDHKSSPPEVVYSFD